MAAALAAPVCLGHGSTRIAQLSFLLGWAGHVAADVLTHGSDARPHARKRRPPLCPVSSYRFESDISYRERYRHHALPFTIAEPAAVLVARETTTGAANTYHRSARAALKPTHSPCSSVHSAPGPTVNNNPPPA